MPGFEVFGEEEKRQIQDVLDTGVLFRYEFAEQRRGVYKVREFEGEIAGYCGTGYAQAVTSGTAALKVALAALGGLVFADVLYRDHALVGGEE